jgi:DNA invertase Pin-like site-specific DNA recombinase
LFNVLAMVAEFEADLIRMRTREGMKVARAKGRLRGKQPKLTPKQEAVLAGLHAAGEHTSSELAQLFGVARSTVYPRARAPGPRRRACGCTGAGAGGCQEARSGRRRLRVW